MNNVNHIEGVHNDGAVNALVLFTLNGEAAYNFIAIPYKGGRPQQDKLDEYAQKVTECKTAKVVSFDNIDLGFGEDNYTCPNSHHVKAMNPPTAPAGNPYEPAQSTELLEPTIIKVKVVRVNQTTSYTQKSQKN